MCELKKVIAERFREEIAVQYTESCMQLKPTDLHSYMLYVALA